MSSPDPTPRECARCGGPADLVIVRQQINDGLPTPLCLSCSLAITHLSTLPPLGFQDLG